MRVNLARDGDKTLFEAEVSDSLADVADLIGAEWLPGLTGEEDARWNPAEIAVDHPPGADNTHFVLRLDGRVQGYAVLQHRRGWKSGEPGDVGPYLAYLAAAPWNRKRDGRRIDTRFTRFVPVGKALLSAVVERSVSLGFHGRIAFHSLGLATSWYENELQDLASFGLDWDGEADLPYFESDAPVSAAFLAKAGIRFS